MRRVIRDTTHTRVLFYDPIYALLTAMSFLVFWIGFRKAKQIVITFIATTFKALLSVAETSIRLSRNEFHTGNVYYPFFNILAHISPFNI